MGEDFGRDQLFFFWMELSALRQRRVASIKLGLFEIACDCFLVSTRANCDLDSKCETELYR